MSVDQTGIFVKPQNRTRDAFLGGRLTAVAAARRLSRRLGFGAARRRRFDRRPARARTRRRRRGCRPDRGAWADGRREVLPGRARRANAGPRCVDNIAANGSVAPRPRPSMPTSRRPAAEREAAGLVPSSFDAVIANPPFFVAGRGTPAGRGGRDAARHAGRADIGLLGPDRRRRRRPARRGDLHLAGGAARRGAGRLRKALRRPQPSCRSPPAPGAEASRILVRGIKGSRAATAAAGAAGAARAGAATLSRRQFDDILRGRTNLRW